MAEIDNYQDSSPDESDNVESSKGKSDSEKSSRDEEDPLSLPICARDILVWIYEAFSYLGKYAGKSLDTPLPIPCLLRWYTSKTNIIFVHPYLTPNVCEMEQNYMKTFKPYIDEVKGAVIDVLNAQLKGVTIFTSRVESADDEYLGDHNIVQSCVNSVSVAVIVVDKVTCDHVDEVAVDEVVVDDVASDEVECAVDLVTVVDEVAIDEVAVDVVDEVAIDEVAVDVVDEVTIDEVAVNVVDEVASAVDDVVGAVDPVAIDVVDEVTVIVNDVAGVVDPVTVDIVDEVTGNAIDEVAEQKEEEKTKEKSVDDEEEKEEDDCAENDQWM
ncbi:hypothetical protein H5410_047099 [Solanum commersonii]|uniref:Uncharacterized protein n=1 Tax=Solanum commersonii TaxID=4109 RepID=A0A9J5XE37_SOLCO|nr:hypothetical protein H5410_047099 [Solanum commersonii]